MKGSYADPTANTAIANVDRERRREEKRRKQELQREYEAWLRELERETRCHPPGRNANRRRED